MCQVDRDRMIVELRAEVERLKLENGAMRREIRDLAHSLIQANGKIIRLGEQEHWRSGRVPDDSSEL